MARSQLSDYLTTNHFLVLDVSLSVPPVFLPVFGFRSVTLPTLNLEYRSVKEGNYEFPRLAALQQATVSSVTLEQGVSLMNSDFYNWISTAVTGHKEAKNILIVQFHRADSKEVILKSRNPLAGFAAMATLPATALAGGLASGFNFEFVNRLPGRAWLLQGCRPITYRPGSDLNAETAEISIASLELAVEVFDEYNYGIL